MGKTHKKSGENKNRTPLFHVVKRGRDALPWYYSIGIRAIAIALALIVAGIVITLLTKKNPFEVYASMIDGVFGSQRRVWNLLQNMAMLLCVALAVTPAFKM
ncbi:MAG: ABC transporter permease, partial [Ruminococcaceae bacterium]|nr:ABC transporter permease [Oscillospiraceae bacterium]